jgi:hypothetical protein
LDWDEKNKSSLWTLKRVIKLYWREINCPSINNTYIIEKIMILSINIDISLSVSSKGKGRKNIYKDERQKPTPNEPQHQCTNTVI